MDKLKGYQKSIILAVVLAVLAFFWIWLYRSLGGSAYWVALVAFAVYVASGSKPKKLPWMVLGGVVGVILGFLAFGLASQVFPAYAVISAAIAGGIFILIGGLLSVPKMVEILPMMVVGWACFLGAIAQYEYLFLEQTVWAVTKTYQTLFGVILSLLIGLVIGAIVATPLLGAIKRKPVAMKTE